MEARNRHCVLADRHRPLAEPPEQAIGVTDPPGRLRLDDEPVSDADAAPEQIVRGEPGVDRHALVADTQRRAPISRRERERERERERVPPSHTQCLQCYQCRGGRRRCQQSPSLRHSFSPRLFPNEFFLSFYTRGKNKRKSEKTRVKCSWKRCVRRVLKSSGIFFFFFYSTCVSVLPSHLPCIFPSSVTLFPPYPFFSLFISSHLSL